MPAASSLAMHSIQPPALLMLELFELFGSVLRADCCSTGSVSAGTWIHVWLSGRVRDHSGIPVGISAIQRLFLHGDWNWLRCLLVVHTSYQHPDSRCGQLAMEGSNQGIEENLCSRSV